MNSNRKAGFVVTLIVFGAGLFFNIVMIMRSGGLPRILLVVLAIAISYFLYNTVMRFKRDGLS